MFKKLFAEADSLVDKIVSCRIKFSNLKTLKVDDVEPGVLLSVFANRLLRKNADVPDNYFTLFDAAGISPTLVLDRISKAKERENWVLFKTGTSEAAKFVHAEWCCFWPCAQCSEN